MVFSGTILWLVALVAIILWIPQNATHEGAHALVARHYGATITKMWLYPNDDDGNFSFTPWAAGHAWARVWWKGGVYDDRARGFISLAPVATNTTLVAVLLAVRYILGPEGNVIVASILAAWALTNFADAAFNLATFYRPTPKTTTDGWGFQRRLELPVWLCRVGAVVWHLGFGALLFLPWPWS